MAPHTSNWDFVLGKLAFRSYGVKVKILIKKELFAFPFGWFTRWMGGIPVNRKGNNNLTDTAVKYFQENDTMFMLFTPEGTRSHSPNWKKGFYYIALKAKVPIYLGYIDYKNKTGGFHGLFEPTGNVAEDILSIKRELHQYKGKFPENGIRDEDIN